LNLINEGKFMTHVETQNAKEKGNSKQSAVIFRVFLSVQSSTGVILRLVRCLSRDRV
jgi:hypothetical protein